MKAKPQIIISGNDAPEEQDKPDLKYKFFAHDSIVFEDDVWDLHFRSTTASTPSGEKLSFRAFSISVKDEVKKFIAHLCWGEDLSNGSLKAALVTLRKALPLLEEQHKTDFSLLKLSQNDARAIEEFFTPSKSGREEVALVAKFARFLRKQYNQEPSDFRPNPSSLPFRRKFKRAYSDGLEQVLPDEVSSALMKALYQEQIALEEEIIRNTPERLSTTHLYPVILLILLFSGRRTSEILLLKQRCLREPTPDELKEIGYDGIWLVYHDTKSHKGEREIFIQEPASHLIKKEVARIRAQTLILAQQSGLDYLFLTDTKIGLTGSEKRKVRRISHRSFIFWLNGRTSDDNQVLYRGFTHRHNIKYQGEYYYINPHQTRHTLAHKAYLGGASYIDVGDHLGHKQTREGLSPMTGVYIHGQERSVQNIRKMHEHRLVLGKATPLIENRSVNVINLAPHDVAIWREQGMVVQPTLYGH